MAAWHTALSERRRLVDERLKRKRSDYLMAMIKASGLCKSFRIVSRRPGIIGGLRSMVDPQIKHVAAVTDLTLQVEQGEMVGLIGPNGAGKSTTIKMLTGVLVPTGGEVEVAGLDPYRERRQLAYHIGVVFGQKTQLWWDLPLIDSLLLLRHLYHVPARRHTQNLAQLSDLLGLDEFIQTPVRQLSLGQRMRGDLAAALLHDPELLYLDEPTIGLDVVAKARIRELLLDINRNRGVTVLLTTHDLADIEVLCPRMVIVDHGRKLFDGLLTSIRDKFGGERTLVAELQVEDSSRPPGQPNIAELPAGVRQLPSDWPYVVLAFNRDALPAQELIAWLGARYQLHDVTFSEPQVEDIIRRIYENGLLLTGAKTAALHS
jgi:ABC-2 type transport system ATP-binding protein